MKFEDNSRPQLKQIVDIIQQQDGTIIKYPSLAHVNYLVSFKVIVILQMQFECQIRLKDIILEDLKKKYLVVV